MNNRDSDFNQYTYKADGCVHNAKEGIENRSSR